MPLDSTLFDSKTGYTARITSAGALTTMPPSASSAYNATLETDDTPVNVVPVLSGSEFCITGIILVGNKNISTSTDATVTLYEAGDAETAVSDKDILIVPVARSTSVILTGIFLGVREGKYINAVTTDDDVLVTILGFYVDII